MSDFDLCILKARRLCLMYAVRQAKRARRQYSHIERRLVRVTAELAAARGAG